MQREAEERAITAKMKAALSRMLNGLLAAGFRTWKLLFLWLKRREILRRVVARWKNSHVLPFWSQWWRCVDEARQRESASATLRRLDDAMREAEDRDRTLRTETTANDARLAAIQRWRELAETDTDMQALRTKGNLRAILYAWKGVVSNKWKKAYKMWMDAKKRREEQRRAERAAKRQAILDAEAAAERKKEEDLKAVQAALEWIIFRLEVKEAQELAKREAAARKLAMQAAKEQSERERREAEELAARLKAEEVRPHVYTRTHTRAHARTHAHMHAHMRSTLVSTHVH